MISFRRRVGVRRLRRRKLCALDKQLFTPSRTTAKKGARDDDDGVAAYLVRGTRVALAGWGPDRWLGIGWIIFRKRAVVGALAHLARGSATGNGGT